MIGIAETSDRMRQIVTSSIAPAARAWRQQYSHGAAGPNASSASAYAGSVCLKHIYSAASNHCSPKSFAINMRYGRSKCSGKNRRICSNNMPWRRATHEALKETNFALYFSEPNHLDRPAMPLHYLIVPKPSSLTAEDVFHDHIYCRRSCQ
jgi:hypothetical protein